MFVNLVQFGYFLLFGLLQVSIEQALVGETGSDVTLVIEFENYPLSCNKINITFDQFKCISSRSRPYKGKSVMTFTNNGVRCLSIIDSDYETRIFNVSINFPTSVTFGLKNVSVYDSGCYLAMDEDWDFINKNSSGHLKKRILLVGDTILRTCPLKQTEFEFFVPLSAFKKAVVIVFYSGISWYEDFISICNPEAGACLRPLRMNGSRITMTLTSVQMEDEGIYVLRGPDSRIFYQSAVLNVIECASPTPASDVVLNSRTFISSAAPITDQSFVNYFVGGGVVAGITIVILTCWFLWKRCYGIRGNGADGDDYNTIDVHYYSSVRNQNQCVTQSEATTGSVSESQQRSAVLDEPLHIYDNI